MTDRIAEIEQRVIDKCEQYWNESGIPIPEIHAILEFIHREVILLSNLVDTKLREREEALKEAKSLLRRLHTQTETIGPGIWYSNAKLFLEVQKALAHPAMQAGEEDP